MEAPKPKEIVIREVPWNVRYETQLYIWTTTLAAYNWVAKVAPNFGSYEEALRPDEDIDKKSGYAGEEGFRADYHILIIPPVYDVQEVIEYLANVPKE